MKKLIGFSLLASAIFVGLVVLFGTLFEKAEQIYPDVKEFEKISIPVTNEKRVIFSLKKHIRTIRVKSAQVLKLEGEVGSNIDDLISRLNKANRDKSIKEIFLLIDSPGGQVFQGTKFISAMEASDKPVHTVCVGRCASMAAMIHQYGAKRFSVDRSALMFHDAAGGLQGPVPQMQSRLSFINRVTTKMDAYVAKRAGIALDKFLADCHTEVWMDGEDAVDQHFSDELVYMVIEDEVPTTPMVLLPPEENGMDSLETFRNVY